MFVCLTIFMGWIRPCCATITHMGRVRRTAMLAVLSRFLHVKLWRRALTIFGDGSQMRSFTYVDDVVKINKLVAIRDDTAGQAYNCA